MAKFLAEIFTGISEEVFSQATVRVESVSRLRQSTCFKLVTRAASTRTVAICSHCCLLNQSDHVAVRRRAGRPRVPHSDDEQAGRVCHIVIAQREPPALA
jgi:hypothetical protein